MDKAYAETLENKEELWYTTAKWILLAWVWEVKMKPKQNKNYIVGIYARLSRDDGQDSESTSIENQRLILTKYVN